MVGGKKVGTKGSVTKPYLVKVFMHSNLCSLSVHCPSIFFLRSDNTSGIGRLDFTLVGQSNCRGICTFKRFVRLLV